MKQNDIDIITVKFFGIVNNISQLEKKHIFKVDDTPLTSYQIHLIDCIGKYDGITTTELATLLKVTKSAVSQKVSWLEKRGFIYKIKNHTDSRETSIVLSKSGKEAYNVHDDYHKEVDMEFFQIFKNLDDDQTKLIMQLIDGLDKMVTRFSPKTID